MKKLIVAAHLAVFMSSAVLTASASAKTSRACAALWLDRAEAKLLRHASACASPAAASSASS
jgi:hypothetical protein